MPKYYQLLRVIENLARADDLGAGRKIPSERELVEKYSVSRATVRKAISDLVAAGVLYRERGKGTFVADPQSVGSQISRYYPSSLGLVMPYIAQQDYLSNEVVRGVQETARLNGYYVVFMGTNGSIDREREIVQDLSRGVVKGLIILPVGANFERGYEHIVELHRSKYPFILIDRFFRDLETDYVVTDNEAAAYQVVRHLIESGYRRIGCIAWPESRITSVEDRLNGYKRALREHGIPFDAEIVEIFGESESRVRALIRKPGRPVAVFCTNAEIALRTLKIIREEGLKVPEDIALVGFDDVGSKDPDIGIGVTNMRQPFSEVGSVAVRKLLRRIRGEVDPEQPQQVVLSSTLVVRESSGSTVSPPPGGESPEEPYTGSTSVGVRDDGPRGNAQTRRQSQSSRAGTGATPATRA